MKLRFNQQNRHKFYYEHEIRDTNTKDEIAAPPGRLPSNSFGTSGTRNDKITVIYFSYHRNQAKP